MTDEAVRAAVLRELGATEDEVAELLRYGENRFRRDGPLPDLPLEDEPFVEAWEAYAREAEARGAAEVLRERLPQLCFPVREGMSDDEAYRAATRRGAAVPADAEPLRLEAPEALRLFLHPTAAGHVPVLAAGSRADFVSLVRALARRNEPSPVPPAMGALAVAGYVNWDRVAALRRRWERGEEPLAGAPDWPAAMRELRERRDLYQDRFLLLSDGPYSGVPAAEVGMGDAAWREASLTIRLEHEAAHYLTRRVLGSMQNALLDELIADHAGIVAAAGRFRADWFLRFLGLEGEEGCRPEGRMSLYRGDPPLSEGAFAVLGRLVRRAAAALEAWDAGLPAEERTREGRARTLLALAEGTLEELAAR